MVALAQGGHFSAFLKVLLIGLLPPSPQDILSSILILYHPWQRGMTGWMNSTRTLSVYLFILGNSAPP